MHVAQLDNGVAMNGARVNWIDPAWIAFLDSAQNS
jgi:hypothetical protein